MHSPHSNPNVDDELLQAYRDGLLDDEQCRQVEAHLTRDPELAACFARETRWLAALRRNDDFADAQTFTRQVVAQWAQQPYANEPAPELPPRLTTDATDTADADSGVLARIGGHKPAIAIACAAMLALAVGLTQMDWLAHTGFNTPQHETFSSVSSLVMHVGERYDQQVTRVSHVLDRPDELIDLENMLARLIERTGLLPHEDELQHLQHLLEPGHDSQP